MKIKIYKMARIEGIQIEKNFRGQPSHVRINLKKYGKEIAPFLEKIGALEPDIDWENGITAEELLNRLKPKIKKLFEK